MPTPITYAHAPASFLKPEGVDGSVIAMDLKSGFGPWSFELFLIQGKNMPEVKCAYSQPFSTLAACFWSKKGSVWHFAMDSSHEGFIESVVDSWMDDPVIKVRGSSTSKVSLVSKTRIDRTDVRENCAVLIPVIRYLVMKPNISMLVDATRTFLWRTRPRGKPDISSTMAVKRFFS